MWNRKIEIKSQGEVKKVDYVEGSKELKQYLEQSESSTKPFDCPHLFVSPQDFAYKHFLEPMNMKKGRMFCMDGITALNESLENKTEIERPFNITSMYGPLYCSIEAVNAFLNKKGNLEVKCWRKKKVFLFGIEKVKDFKEN